MRWGYSRFLHGSAVRLFSPVSPGGSPFSFFFLKCGLLVLSFFLGYLLFSAWGVRVGVRPSWDAVGADHALASVFTACTSAVGDTQVIVCVRKGSFAQIRRWGLRAMMQALGRKLVLSGPDDFVSVRCHDIAHALGQASSMQSDAIGTTLNACTDLCGSGCFHGAIEGWLARGFTIDTNSVQLCGNSQLSQDAAYACYHGLGHAIADINGYNLLSALHACDSYSGDGRIACGSGVFMELFEPISSTHPTVPMHPEDPTWCRAFPSPYDEICYNRSGVYAYRNTHDIAQAVGVCLQAPIAYRRDCIGAVGKNLYFSYPPDPALTLQARAFCAMYLPAAVSDCMVYIQSNMPR